MSTYRLIQKRLIGNSAIKSIKASNASIYFKSTRTFSIAQESMDFPEISEGEPELSDYFQSLSNKSLLEDENVMQIRDLRDKRKQMSITAKEERGKSIREEKSKAENDKYPEIFQQFYDTKNPQEIKQLAMDYVNTHTHVPIKRDYSFDFDAAIEQLSNLANEQNDDDNDFGDDSMSEVIASDTDKAQINNPLVITKAMARCLRLNAYDTIQELYEFARQNDAISNSLYSFMFMAKMSEKPNNEGLAECFDLFEKWNSESKVGGLPLRAPVYISLLRSCEKVRNFGKAFHVYNNLIMKDKDEQEIEDLMQAKSLRSQLLNLFVQAQGVESGIRFVSNIKSKYGELPNQTQLVTLIMGCARDVHKNPNLVDVAQKLFMTAFDVMDDELTEWGTHKISPRLFEALLAVYSKAGDYQSCLDLINRMQSKETWPNPTIFCINPTLKSLSVHNYVAAKKGKDDEIMSNEEKQKLVDELMQIAEDNKMEVSVVTYSLLFRCCDYDKKKLKKLYEEMVNEKGLIPNEMALSNLMLAGLDCFRSQIQNGKALDGEIEGEISEFIDWALAEYKKYGLAVTERARHRLKLKLDDIKALQQ